MADATEGPPPDPPAVTVRLPGLLARFTADEDRVTVRAETVAGAVETLLQRYPALEPHLRDGDGGLRAHLQLFLEGTAVPEGSAADVSVDDGDEIVVLQAVSGG